MKTKYSLATNSIVTTTLRFLLAAIALSEALLNIRSHPKTMFVAE